MLHRVQHPQLLSVPLAEILNERPHILVRFVSPLREREPQLAAFLAISSESPTVRASSTPAPAGSLGHKPQRKRRATNASRYLDLVCHCPGLYTNHLFAGENSGPTVVDLFCGCGGLTLGLVAAGFRSTLAIDRWPAALETFRQNIGDHVRQSDLASGPRLPECDVIVGGPPCQGFSSAGLREDGDSRNSLVRDFASIIAECKPKAFIFENVEGFLTAGNGKYLRDLLAPTIAAGYWIHLRKVNAANFGVPQHRKRVIAVGGLGFDPGFPALTHQAFGAPGRASPRLAANRPGPSGRPSSTSPRLRQVRPASRRAIAFAPSWAKT